MKNIEAFYPLSPMQQGMFFHSLDASESGAYLQQVSCVLRGKLDVPAFEKAWQQIVNRHPTAAHPPRGAHSLDDA